MSARNPIDVFEAMHAAHRSGADARARVLAVREAMLTATEIVAVASVVDADDRTDADWAALDRVVARLLESSRFTAPELLFAKPHREIGQAILRQCEIEAINRAYSEVQP
jgi:hypothetical protein